MKRTALFAVIAVAGLSPPAMAFKFDFGGGYAGAFDSTVSYGLQMRMQNRACGLIARDNGGCASLTAPLPEASQDAYFLNADDGDQNYNKYDLFSEVIKGTHELQLKMPDDWSFFGRVSELYDFRIGETERTPLADEARRFSVYNFQPLDAYVNKDFDWFGHNARVRVGWQVLSWGEDIFVLGGINSTNAIDVRRSHVAGTQVKEILRPAPMISLNSDLIEHWGMEAYYQWHWNSFLLDPTGTYFSSADPVGKGNNGAIFIPTSAINAGLAANPIAKPLLGLGLIRPAPTGTVGDSGGTRLSAQQLESAKYVSPRLIKGFSTGGPISTAVATLLVDAALGTGTAIPLASDRGGSNHGQYGLNLRYRPEWVDASFGFYYERYNSKIPFVSYTVNSAYKTDNPASAAYRIEYPGGIDLFGASYNTNLAGWAFGGELSWRPRDAVAIDPSVPSGTIADSAPYACVNGGGEAAGKYCRGWVDRSKLQLQQSALQIFSPTEGFGGWVLTTLGASEGYFLGELGATDYPGLDRLGGVPWSLPAYALPDKFSAGYTFESQITYPNVMNLGFDWLPQIDWSQGVIGNTPNALPWQEGAKAATFTLNLNRHNIITAALAYSWFWGGGTQNQTSDRDYLSFTLAYNF
ncbi:MAG: DUF1302 domain-containing protein [Nevskia sp.]|nr:DUF1302 domain-containing protein [Nevskia sp.]